MKFILVIPFLVLSLYAQPVMPLQPSLISSGLGLGYCFEKQMNKGFSLQLAPYIGTQFSMVPLKGGAALSFYSLGEARYCFGKKYMKGFGVAANIRMEFLINPIYYKDERIDCDILMSIIPGVKLFYRFEPFSMFSLEPYVNGHCHFFKSLLYQTPLTPFVGFSFGIHCYINKEQIKRLLENRGDS